MKKNQRLFLIMPVVVVGLWLSLAAPAGAAEITVSKPTGSEVVSESNDFAGRQFSDPWDMSQRTDIAHGEYFNDLGDMRWSGGMLSAKSIGTDAYIHPLFPGYRDALPIGRDGMINRIDTSKYNRFSVRMYSDRRTSAQLLWFYNQTWTDYGLVTFRVEPGWNTYVVDPATSGRWTGRAVGLRFDPTYQDGVNFKIDWMRLYQQSGTRVEVAWSDQNPGQDVELYLDNDTDGGNGNLGLIDVQTSGQSNTYWWDPSPHQPGNYYIYIKKPGEAGVYSGRVIINRAPLIAILDPDDRGGADYATSAMGNPWDMGQAGDLAYWSGIKDVSFSGGIMAGTTVHDDGYFHLNVPTPIDTNKYHRLSFRYRYDGPFDFGLGTMTRYIWSPSHYDIGKYQTIDDIVTYPHWQTYVIDLKKAKLDWGSIGWNGKMTDFRFDPLEVPGQWRFYVDYVRLAADDAANRAFTIKWRDSRKAPRPTRVSLYFDTDRSGFNGTSIAKGLAQVAGTNYYNWNTSKVRAGTYYVYAVASDGVSTTKKYSSGPIVINH